jgi:hypothetical protein
MRTVYKYSLDAVAASEDVLMLPAAAQILTAAFQGDVLQVWALVDTLAPLRARRFGVYGTGHPIPQQRQVYIATAFTGPLVFHVFEILS